MFGSSARNWKATFLMKLSRTSGKFLIVALWYLLRQNMALDFLSIHKNASLIDPLPSCFIILNLFSDFLFMKKLGLWAVTFSLEWIGRGGTLIYLDMLRSIFWGGQGLLGGETALFFQNPPWLKVRFWVLFLDSFLIVFSSLVLDRSFCSFYLIFLVKKLGLRLGILGSPKFRSICGSRVCLKNNLWSWLFLPGLSWIAWKVGEFDYSYF